MPKLVKFKKKNDQISDKEYGSITAWSSMTESIHVEHPVQWEFYTIPLSVNTDSNIRLFEMKDNKILVKKTGYYTVSASLNTDLDHTGDQVSTMVRIKDENQNTVRTIISDSAYYKSDRNTMISVIQCPVLLLIQEGHTITFGIRSINEAKTWHVLRETRTYITVQTI